MALPMGLVPVVVFSVTVGIACPTALTAYWLDHAGDRSYEQSVRYALLAVGVLYLFGTRIV
ncbi:MAG: hypothetical protein ABEH65_08695 [Halobacteriales archaeon]